MTATVESRPHRRPSKRPARPKYSERTAHERRLGLILSAPAFIVMMLVTATRLATRWCCRSTSYRLTDPAGKEFVGLSNYVTVLTDPIWWNDFSTTRSSPWSAWSSSWCSASASPG